MVLSWFGLVEGHFGVAVRKREDYTFVRSEAFVCLRLRVSSPVLLR